MTIEKWKAEQQLLHEQQFLSLPAMAITEMGIGDESAKQPSAYVPWPGSLNTCRDASARTLSGGR